jgi:hypothetical protein
MPHLYIYIYIYIYKRRECVCCELNSCHFIESDVPPQNSDLSEINTECVYAIYNIPQAEHEVDFLKQTNLPCTTCSPRDAANVIAMHVSHSCMPY